jgi:hypothetical protein
MKLLSNYFVYSLLDSFFYFELLFALSSIISELVFIKLLSNYLVYSLLASFFYLLLLCMLSSIILSSEGFSEL